MPLKDKTIKTFKDKFVSADQPTSIYVKYTYILFLGTDITIIGFSRMLSVIFKAMDELNELGVSAEVCNYPYCLF